MSKLKIIKNRRSIRKFEKKDISNDFLNQILESARWSPSWGNTQCWEIIVIKNPDIKAKLQKIISDKNPATPSIIKAPVVIAICGKLGKAGYYKGKAYTKFNDWFMYDLGIVTQNIALTAHCLGYNLDIVSIHDTIES